MADDDGSDGAGLRLLFALGGVAVLVAALGFLVVWALTYGPLG